MIPKVPTILDAPYPFIQSNDGEGCYIKDIEGNTFLDMTSQIATVPLGYNHPKLCKISEKYAGKSPIKVAGQDFYIEEHFELIKELLTITSGFVFLSNSGAEAVENAIKLCYNYTIRGRIGISCENAFHGRTLGALSLTNSKFVHKSKFPEIPVKRIPFCSIQEEQKLGECIERLDKLFKREVHPLDVAYFIVEVVQGEGGYNIIHPYYLEYIRELTLKHDIPLIIDEIQSGLGRTGKWWAYQHYNNIEPDIITSAKALQVGATIAKKDFTPKKSGMLSNTWGGGHKIDLATGTEIIRVIKQENLLKNATEMGHYFLSKLRELEKSFRSLISNSRGLGLMLAFDIESIYSLNRLISLNYEKGLLTLSCGESSLRLLPPLTINKKEIDEAVSILEENLFSIT